MMKSLFAMAFLVLNQTASSAQDTFQLAPPYLRYSSVFFEKEARVSMEFAQAGTQIHYTTNGQEPTESDPVYTQPLRLKKQRNMLKAKIFGKGFFASETVKVTFFKQGKIIKTIQNSSPNERFLGDGPNTLIDGKGGIGDLNSSTWMGFDQDTITLILTLKKPQKVQRGLLHVLQHQNAWIFPPQWVETCFWNEAANDWGFPYSSSYQITEHSGQITGKALWMGPYRSAKRVQKIRIRILPLESMPDWHPGKGKPAWFFMDEIILY